ncbi:MAG TPA: hypothetical protein VIF09_15050 [Polyangiaceae bacterium]
MIAGLRLAGALSLAVVGCSNARIAPPPAVPPSLTVADPCRVDAQACRHDAQLTVDLAPVEGPVLISSEAAVEGGLLEASFDEAGIPSFQLAVNPGADVVLLHVTAVCDGHRVVLRARVDVRDDGHEVPTVSLEQE